MTEKTDKLLIATDFDGTLNIDGKVSEYDRRAIDEWRAAGRYFGVVTGRGTDFFETAKQINLPYDYLVLYNGSLVADSNEKIFFEAFIDDSLFRQLSEFFAQYEDAEYFMEYDGSRIRQYYATFENVERALEVCKQAEERFGTALNVFVNGRHVNIGNIGTGKADGIDIVLKHFGLPADAAAAVGDDYNDLDMIIKHCGWAVESGKPEVVAKAPHVCGSVGELIHTLLKNS